MWTTLVRWICIVVVQAFYREIAARFLAKDEIDWSRPTLIVANHPNALMDPIVLKIALGKRIGFLAKSSLFENWFGLTAMNAFEAIPVYRSKDGEDTAKNADMFKAVYVAMSEKRWIALFPEGVSHDEPQIQPLKTGAARMYFGASDYIRDGGVESNIQVLPIGLDYEHKDIFRSRVNVTVGSPMNFEGLNGSREDVEAVTQVIARALSEVTLVAGSAEIRNGFLWASKWLEGEDASVDRVAERAQEISDAFATLMERDQKEADSLVEDVRQLVRRLQKVGLDVWEIDESLEPSAFVPYVLGAPIALIGALLSYPTYWIIRPLAFWATKGERDLLSTAKAIGGLMFFPATWAVEAFIAWQVAPWFGLLVAAFAAPVSFFSIQYFERLQMRRSAIKAFTFRKRDPDSARQILRDREILGDRIAALLSSNRSS